MKKFGLLGEEISYSLSGVIHNYIFEKNKYEGEYELYSRGKSDLESFVFMAKKELSGFNVTIPYKESIIEYIDFLSPEAKCIGAVNTVKIIDEKLYGYNTDYYGFGKQLSFGDIKIKNKEFVILGSGGAQKAVKKYLKDNGGKVTIISRNPKLGQEGYGFLKNIKKSYCLVNTTPIGTFPKVEASPVDEEIINKFECIADLVYNPIETKLIKIGKKNHKITTSGMVMLLNQGLEAQRIWTSLELKEYEKNQLFQLLKESIEE